MATAALVGSTIAAGSSTRRRSLRSRGPYTFHSFDPGITLTSVTSIEAVSSVNGCSAISPDLAWRKELGMMGSWGVRVGV